MSKNKLIPELRFPEFVNEGEWEIKTIGDIANSVSSSMALNKLDLKPTGYPVYGADSIVGFIDEFQHKEKYISIVKDGSGVGRLNLCQSNSSILGTLTSLKSKNKKQYDLVWFYYLLNTVNFSVYVKGAGIPHIYFSDFKNENVPVPNPKEQQKIASCLSTLDEVITAHNQKLELLKAHKKGLMQNLFPQLSESGLSKYKDDKIISENEILKSYNPKNHNSDNVPKYRFKEFQKDGEWVEKKLGDLIEIKGRIGYRGYTLEDIVGKGEGAISMSPSNINEFGTLSFTKSTYITWAKYEESPEIMLQDGFTVLVKTGSTYGKVAFIKNLQEKTTINPQLVVLKPKTVNNYFLYLLVANAAIQKQINATVVGGAIPTLSQESISNFEIIVPKTKEQEKIAECLSSLNELIISHTEKLDQLQLHKKGLMQGLFPKIKE